MNKKTKTKTILIGLTTTTLILLLLTTSTMGTTTILTTLDYQETSTIIIPGNITLEYISSDTGTNDISFNLRAYEQTTDVTIYILESLEITYNPDTFNNDTKQYLYIDNGTSEFYIIQIDYSSIQLPIQNGGLLEQLNQTIIEQQIIIQNLQNTISNQSNHITTLNTTILEQTEQITQWRTLAEQYQQDYLDEIDTNLPLREKIIQLDLELNTSRNETMYEWNEARHYENLYHNEQSQHNQTGKCLHQSSDFWNTGYIYHGQQKITVNGVSILIGLIIGIIAMSMVFKIDFLKKITQRFQWKDKRKKKSKKTVVELFGYNDPLEVDDLPITTPSTLKEWNETTSVKTGQKPAETSNQTTTDAITQTLPTLSTKQKYDYNKTSKDVDNLIATKFNHNNTEVI